MEKTQEEENKRIWNTLEELKSKIEKWHIFIINHFNKHLKSSQKQTPLFMTFFHFLVLRLLYRMLKHLKQINVVIRILVINVEAYLAQ